MFNYLSLYGLKLDRVLVAKNLSSLYKFLILLLPVLKIEGINDNVRFSIESIH